ncbi:MAG: hypothetical protein MI924_25960 [Chloroflexales bacterium]|nr:hypothetical protein [Chloroflexales bacterium]
MDNNCTSGCKGYYSYNLGAWHIIVLNSEISVRKGSEQEQWLRSDLAANSNVCTLAYWRRPLFSSGRHGNNSSMKPLWEALYEYGADVALNGQDHHYEVFNPQDPNGNADPDKGIREFVVDAGGRGLYSMGSTRPNSAVCNNSTWGVLKLSLYSSSYDWEFVPISGQSFRHSGKGTCVGGSTAPTPTQPRATAPPAPGGGAVFSDDFETNKGWTTNPNGNDTATTDQWERGILRRPTRAAPNSLARPPAARTT